MGSLLVPQGFNRIHVGGTEGGVEAEDDADHGGDGEGDDGGPEADDGDHTGGVTDDKWNGDAQEDAEDAAGAGEQDGFHEELSDDIFTARAEGAANADFTGPLRHAGEHDVHDADAANQK